MFAEVKESLPISGDDYDAQIIREIKACVLDLTTSAEIVLPGEVDITRTHEAATTSEPEKWVITDNSTLTDELAMRAVITYAQMRFGNPPNYQQLADSYDLQKVQLMHAAAYTNYGEEEDGDDEG